MLGLHLSQASYPTEQKFSLKEPLLLLWHYYFVKENYTDLGVEEMAQQLRVLAALAEDQSLFLAPTWQLKTTWPVSPVPGDHKPFSDLQTSAPVLCSALGGQKTPSNSLRTGVMGGCKKQYNV